MTMAKKRVVRNPVGRNGYVLPQEKLEQREKAFAVYRDMGKLRSYPKLLKELKEKHPDVAPSQQGTLDNWARRHDWAARCQARAALKRLQHVGEQPQPRLSSTFSTIRYNSAARCIPRHASINHSHSCAPQLERSYQSGV
jgi:hypothetical protein